jgi:hypothetical protein
MLLRLGGKLDDARLSLIMSVADLYFDPDPDEVAATLELPMEEVRKAERLV